MADDRGTTQSDDGDAIERRFPRRLLLSGSALAAAAGLGEMLAPAAGASAPADSWQLKGNTGVKSDGSNFLGPKNAAPLIFKTRHHSSSPLSERMRITPRGRVGVGTDDPGCVLDVKGSGNKVVRATNASTDSSSSALLGIGADGSGVAGNSTSGSGGTFTSTTDRGVGATGGSYGVVAEGGAIGVYGYSEESGGYGLYGSGDTYGAYGSGNYGLYGSGDTYGAYASGGTAGVYGGGSTGISGHGGSIGVFGGDASNAGVRGNSTYVGVWGTGNTWGVYGIPNVATGSVYGVYGACDSSAGFGVYCDGNAHVSGTLSKSAGSFKIDHPLDPENRWLSHSFVESPDMLNVYSGNVILDHEGTATIDLPDYFAVLNHEFRYQLTTIGGHAPVYIATKIEHNQFRIAGGTAGLEVSWQVTGIRKDDYAKHNPIVVDTPKSADERGTLAFVPPGVNATRMNLGPRAVEIPKRHQPAASTVAPPR